MNPHEDQVERETDSFLTTFRNLTHVLARSWRICEREERERLSHAVQHVTAAGERHIQRRRMV